MSLPPKYVDRIFARLLIRYGAAWIRMWEGIDEQAVKADWAHVLDGLPEFRLRYGLDHLSADRPPTAPQFRALCNGCADPVAPRLRGPAADPARVAELVAEARATPFANPLAGARALRAREEAGDKSLTMAQREFWRTALRREIAAATKDYRAQLEPLGDVAAVHAEVRAVAKGTFTGATRV